MELDDLTEQCAKARKAVTQAASERDRAEGVLSQLQAQLRKEFGCNNEKEARKLLKELTVKEELASKMANEAWQKYCAMEGAAL